MPLLLPITIPIAPCIKPEDKRIVRDALTSSNIFIAAVARLYISLPNNNVWKYSGLWGAVAFCRDRNKNNSFFIRLIDMDGKGVIWEQELYNGFEYVKDCAFFHTFETDDCLAGLLFVHQGEADIFHEKISNREIKHKKSNDVGRVGYIPGKGFTIDNNDPEILEILRELEKLDDFSAADINQNQEFIQSFIQQYRSTKKEKTRNNMPPPPIPPIKNRSPSPALSAQLPPPPPPLPNRGLRQTQSIPSFPPMSRPPNLAAPPPPPPPPPSQPPVINTPPLTPPMMDYTSSPTLSPIPKNTTAPIPGGRNDLLAAIRSTGGIGSLKKTSTLKTTSVNKNQSFSSTNSSNSKESMANSLAA
ncbi:hypothetical protein INT48_008835 [Thamnidium elegans]|uniref:WH1 domain-containing protein n=1 Tax=Thamnidium elegans TaxID=101142 RepID=A0A8H7SMR2_9FUNG|nr:hypothetical protein INT48_008835 [Thamnidium elegans]